MSLSRLLYTFYDSWILPHICLQKLRFLFSENTFDKYLVFQYHIWHCSMFSTTNSVAAMARWLLDVGPSWLQQHHWCSHWHGKTLATRHHFAQWVSRHKNLDKAKAFMHNFAQAMSINLVTVQFFWFGMCMSACCPLRILGTSNQVSRLGQFRTGN